MEKVFNNQELLNMIKDKDLNIVLVLDVVQSGFEQPYKYIFESDEKLQADIDLFYLSVIDSKYILLSDEEIKHIKKEGALKW